MSDAPPPDSPPRGTPAHRSGAARADAVPRMENVRITQPDLLRRGALEKTRNRIVYTAFGFGLLFLAVIAKLADATIVQPIAPHRPETPIAALFTPQKSVEATDLAQRAMITDRNGQILAISLPTVAVFADPRQIIDPADAAHRLKQVLPRLDEDAARARVTGILDGDFISGLEQKASTQVQALLGSVHHDHLLGRARHRSRSGDVPGDLFAQRLVAARILRITQRVGP